MKYICIILLSVLSLNSSFARSEVLPKGEIEIYSETDEKLETTIVSSTVPMRICTLSINIELADGTTIEGVVTIEGISLFQCWGLHIYDWFSGDF